jgi:aspartate carbamoyltransferase catalytic subunit
MFGTHRSLIDIEDLTAGEVVEILDCARSFKEVNDREIKKLPTLRGRTVVNLFLEPSTRTRTSFEIAAKRLSADAVNFSAASSSTKKGESLADTAATLDAMDADLVVVRSRQEGAPRVVERHVRACVVNGGDGKHEHPTQALLDAFTMRERFGSLSGLKVGIVGDVAHSRVAGSLAPLLVMMGADPVLVGPSTLMPTSPQGLCREVAAGAGRPGDGEGGDRGGGEGSGNEGDGAARGNEGDGAARPPLRVCHDLDECLPELDVLYMLRIQMERLEGAPLPSLREYAALYGVDMRRLSAMKPGSVIMHPGPVNRGVELSADAADAAQSLILDQVNAGVAVRMAVMYLLLGGDAHGFAA